MPRRFSCGNVTPSQCVPYTGRNLVFLPLNQQPDCDASINEVFDLISKAILAINTAIDLTNQNNQCLIDVPTNVDVKGMFQIQTNEICQLAAIVTTLQEIVNDLNIANELITIDLGCLAAAAAPCQTGTNTYSLISILSLFANQICVIKNYLGI